METKEDRLAILNVQIANAEKAVKDLSDEACRIHEQFTEALQDITMLQNAADKRVGELKAKKEEVLAEGSDTSKRLAETEERLAALQEVLDAAQSFVAQNYWMVRVGEWPEAYRKVAELGGALANVTRALEDRKLWLEKKLKEDGNGA